MDDLNSSLIENSVDDIFYTKKKKCYKNKCVLCGGMCFCVLFIVGIVYINIKCGSFNNDVDLCDVSKYCPNHNCDGSDFL